MAALLTIAMGSGRAVNAFAWMNKPSNHLELQAWHTSSSIGPIAMTSHTLARVTIDQSATDQNYDRRRNTLLNFAWAMS